MSIIRSQTSSCSARLLCLFVFFVATILSQQTCEANNAQNCISSCGKIHNISYPFRLKGDPNGCGDSRYELECENNVTVLYLFNGKYHIHEIDYKFYKIRASDAGVEEHNCSSIPRYFLHPYNFSSLALDDHRYSLEIGVQERYPQIAFYKCSNPVRDDPRYVDTASCVDDTESGSEGHFYAVLDSNGNFSAMDVRVGCRLRVATLAPPAKPYNNNLVSYSEIHTLLVYGFEIWWTSLICEDKCFGKFRKEEECGFNPATGEIKCYGYGSPTCVYGYLETDHCGIWLKIIGYTGSYLIDILKGLVARIQHPATNEYLPEPFSEEALSIGLYVLPPYISIRVLFGYSFLIAFLVYQWRRRHVSMFQSIETFLQDNNLMPIRYSYREIKMMTRGFNYKLGKGGYGSVYKGTLRSGTHVAIKILDKGQTNGQDFISEVATIGRIHHVNVVRLIGFCVEGSRRALIYEFMSNSSLDKYIFSKEGSIPLSYEKIHEISLGVARGIAYLHQGCDMQILHFDIKPHNILLDENFIPKVSDFGLAKLYPTNDNIVSLTAARGTIGYMAPELFYKNIGGVSCKADVYSFGMLLMEMASRRRNSNLVAENSSETYFPLWIYDQFSEEKDIEMGDATEEEKKLAKKMFVVALWCIQLKPCDRPSMNQVVEMLEGDIESLEMPPKPSLYPDETHVAQQEIDTDQTTSTSYSWETSSNPTQENSHRSK